MDKRSLRKIVRTYVEKKGPVRESDMVGDLVQRHKVDEASITRAIEKQIKSRRIERVPGVGLRAFQRRPKRRRRRKTRAAILVTWHYERGDMGRLHNLGSKWFKANGLRELAEHRDWKAKNLGTELKGVYALYRTKGKARTIYYIGRAQNLPSRLKAHQRDRLYGKWDHFSVYGTATKPISATLEKILIKIARPEGNKRLMEKLPIGIDLRRVIADVLKSQASRET